MKSILLAGFISLYGTMVKAETCVVHPTLTRDLGAVSSFYKTFATDQEASDFYTILDREVMAGALGRSPVKAISLDDPRYISLRADMAKIKAVYDQLYPDLAVLPIPHVLILPVSVPNAAALPATPLSEGLIPNIFFVNEGLLNLFSGKPPELTNSARIGLISHELAHMYFRHSDPQISETVTQAYIQAADRPEGFSFIEAFKNPNPELTSAVRSYQSTTYRIGPLSSQDTNGLPFGPGVNNTLIQSIDKRVEKNSQCALAQTASRKWIQFVDEATTPIALTGELIPLTDQQKALGGTLSAAVVSAGRSCFESSHEVSVFEAAGYLLGIPEDVAKQILAGSEIESIYNSEANSMDSILALFKSVESDRDKSAAQLDFKYTRIYTKEDEADAVATLVEHKLNASQSSKRVFIEQLFRSLGGINSRCEESLKTMTMPEYGLYDDHHSSCYRAYSAKRLLGNLETCTN